MRHPPQIFKRHLLSWYIQNKLNNAYIIRLHAIKYHYLVKRPNVPHVVYARTGTSRRKKMLASTCIHFTVISRPGRVFVLAAHLKIFESRKHRGVRFIISPSSFIARPPGIKRSSFLKHKFVLYLAKILFYLGTKSSNIRGFYLD